MYYSKTDLMNDDSFLQRFQNLISESMHVVCRCFEDGNPITESSWNKENLLFIKKYINLDELAGTVPNEALYELDEVKTEFLDKGPVRIARLTVRVANRTIHWVVTAILKDAVDEELKEEEYAEGTVAVSEQELGYTLDLLALMTKEYFRLSNIGELAGKEARDAQEQGRFSDEKLERLQMLNEVLVAADSDQELSIVIDNVLTTVRKRLKFSEYKLFQDEEEWKQHPFKAESTYMISSDTPVPEECRTYMRGKGMHAIMRFPIKDNDRVIFVVEIRENLHDRNWELDEMRLVGDVREILQHMIAKRIHSQSVAASFVSMQSILQNVDFGLAVIDSVDNHVLFTNTYFRKLFEKNGVLEPEDITFFNEQVDGKPVYFSGQNLWIHFHKRSMHWVDGRDAILLEAHDMAEYHPEEAKPEPTRNMDSVTGLYDNAKCAEDFDLMLHRCKEHNQTGAMISVDLDDFKTINSRFGVQRGDELLSNIATRLRKLRSVGKNIYRPHGDQFYILVGPENSESAQEIVREIAQVFERPFEIAGVSIGITCSIGVVTFPNYGDNIRDIESKCEVAMVQAKIGGKNRAEFYNSEMAAIYRKKVDMELQLREVVRSGCKELEVYYQPIMDVSGETAKCTGAEALVRWNSSKYGMVSPAEFIPLAEEMGLIPQIGEFVLREACKTCRYWNDFGHPEYRVNVNFSVIQFMQTDIEEIIKRYLLSTRLNPNNLVVEITESIEVESMRRMNEILSGIRSLGVRTALDDFGTGYSSMTHVREMLVDIIKVDQCFVRSIVDDKYSDTFVKMVIELAEVMHMDVCVEGVETEEQYRLLKDKRVRCIQGYYFNKPLPRAEFEKKYI